jgi:hypothetical protein
MSGGKRSRRDFLKTLPLGAAAFLGVRPRSSGLWSIFGEDHPEPRPGVDASKVLNGDVLSNPAAAPVYDLIREIPEVADGIRCHCGCAELPGYYSLLTCYEEGGMAQFCVICQGQARLAHRRHGEGQSLDQIRNAIDARFGNATLLDDLFATRDGSSDPAAWCGPGGHASGSPGARTGTGE